MKESNLFPINLISVVYISGAQTFLIPGLHDNISFKIHTYDIHVSIRNDWHRRKQNQLIQH